MERNKTNIKQQMEEVKSQYKKENNIKTYLDLMDDKVKIALCIAKDHLGSSFNLKKSNGYVSYNKK